MFSKDFIENMEPTRKRTNESYGTIITDSSGTPELMIGSVVSISGPADQGLRFKRRSGSKTSVDVKGVTGAHKG